MQIMGINFSRSLLIPKIEFKNSVSEIKIDDL